MSRFICGLIVILVSSCANIENDSEATARNQIQTETIYQEQLVIYTDTIVKVSVLRLNGGYLEISFKDIITEKDFRELLPVTGCELTTIKR